MGIRETIQRECRDLRNIGLAVDARDATYHWRIAAYINRGSIPYIVNRLNLAETYPTLLTKPTGVYCFVSMYEFHISRRSSVNSVGWYTDSTTECPIEIIKTRLYVAQLKEFAQEIQTLIENARVRILNDEIQDAYGLVESYTKKSSIQNNRYI